MVVIPAEVIIIFVLVPKLKSSSYIFQSFVWIFSSNFFTHKYLDNTVTNLIDHLIRLVGAITKDSFFDALDIDPEEAEKEDRGREKVDGKGRKEKVSFFVSLSSIDMFY